MRSLKFPLLLSLPMRMYVGLTRPIRIKIIAFRLTHGLQRLIDDLLQCQVAPSGPDCFITHLT